MRSTSFHRFNADLGSLTRLRRGVWNLANIANNLFPDVGTRNGLSIHDFSCPFDKMWAAVPAAASPSRRLCDLFWMELPWSRIVRTLGPLVIHDIGCGSGNIAARISAWCGGAVMYHGFDTQERPQWNQPRPPAVCLARFDGHSFFETMVEGANLFISQSALEHIEGDLDYFEAVRAFVEAAERPILQVHMVPSSSCQRLYGPHGIRQYTPRSLARVARMFPGSQTTVFRLGGPACNEVHLRFISKPGERNGEDGRQLQPREYDAALRRALALDFATRSKKASFYALVIETRFPSPLFANRSA